MHKTKDGNSAALVTSQFNVRSLVFTVCSLLGAVWNEHLKKDKKECETHGVAHCN